MKYTQESYDTLLRQSYAHDPSQSDTGKDFATVRALYEKNYLCRDGEPKIPRKIHQVWIGGELPREYRVFADSWGRAHPDWEYKLWGDRDAQEFGMKNKHFFDIANTNGQKSDIFRYEILQRHGGLYVDTDFECLRRFDDLMYLDFLTSIGYAGWLELYIGLIACVPNHPIINRCVNDMKNVSPHNTVMDVFHTTGSYFFTKCFLAEVTKDTEGVVAMPMPFFYPWPNNDRGCKTPRKYIRSFSYAIHHWAISWLLKK